MNDELTPSERAALRARIVGGAHDIKPVGAHRGAWIAGSVAAVLVVAIAGGVAVTTTLSAPEIATTPTPTVTVPSVPQPSPTRTPTPEPTAESVSLGAAPFDGSCANVVDEQTLADATGHPMQLAGFGWNDARATVRGGLVCWWVSSDEYLAAMVRVAAFPVGEEPTDPETFGEAGCDETEQYRCTRVGTANGMRVWVRMSGSSDAVVTASPGLLDQVVTRVGVYAPGVPATPTSAWWAPLDCETVVGAIDASELGFTSVVVETPTFTSIAGACQLLFRQGDDGWTTSVYVVPGGAVAVPSVIAAGGERVAVAGAREAYWVAAHDGVDGGGGHVLVASDGVNALHVSVGAGTAFDETDRERAIFVADRILPLL